MMPDPLLLCIKKFYYVRVLKSLSEEEIDLKTVKYFVNPGDLAIDVGANIGVITLFLSRLVGDSGCVYSIEPNPMTFEILSHNVSKLKLNNVNLLNYGISDKNRLAIMEVPKYDNSGNENFYQSMIVDSSKKNNLLRHYKVELKSLDCLLSEISQKVSFVKIDVEGHELQAIKGAMQLINQFKPALLIEVSGDPDDKGSATNNLFEQLMSIGYLPYCFDGNILRRRVKGDKSINYFFLTEDHIYNAKQRLLPNSEFSLY